MSADAVPCPQYLLCWCRYTVLRPRFSTQVLGEDARLMGYRSSAVLPNNSPVRIAEGQLQRTRALAQASASLEACKQLHQVCPALPCPSGLLLPPPILSKHLHKLAHSSPVGTTTHNAGAKFFWQAGLYAIHAGIRLLANYITWMGLSAHCTNWRSLLLKPSSTDCVSPCGLEPLHLWIYWVTPPIYNSTSCLGLLMLLQNMSFCKGS